MGKNIRRGGAVLLLVAAVLSVVWYAHHHTFAVFMPRGIIAHEERQLMFDTLLLSLVVVIPVFTMLFFIVRKYREENTDADYRPDWDHNSVIETIWWGLPMVIILILSVVTWQSAHKLDPTRLIGDKKPLTIEVVALQWKWLFIYPEQGVASVNYVRIPEKTPVNFEITADAPMNAFWVPQLGGQVYAMSGMSMPLQLMADGQGRYRGESSNISGDGFAAMHFIVESTSSRNFDTWTRSIATNNAYTLDETQYAHLTKPGVMARPQQFILTDQDLYSNILMKYMPEMSSHGVEHG